MKQLPALPGGGGGKPGGKGGGRPGGRGGGGGIVGGGGGGIAMSVCFFSGSLVRESSFMSKSYP